MALDANIILGVNPDQGKSPNSLLQTLAQVQQIKAQQGELQQQQQAQQTQNSLKAILADPDAIDQETGLPKPATIGKINAIDPKVGTAMFQSVAQAQNTKAEGEVHQSQVFEKKNSLADEARSAALESYDADLAKGTPEPQAKANAQSVYSEGVGNLKKSGLFSKQEADAMPSDFDPVRMRANSAKYQAWKEQKEKDAQAAKKEADADKRADRSETEREKHDRDLEALASRKENIVIANQGQNKWQVLEDPKTKEAYRYNPETAQATTLDGKPYTPTGASKISGGGTARSGAAAAVKAYLDENPNATAEDIAQFNAKVRKEQSAATAFGTGKQGQQVNSFNVSIAHLNTLDKLADALHNGDVPALNKVAKTVQQETGQSAPTNFEAAKRIVGDEIIKAIVGSGGALADRENAQNQINRASSPAQLKGVIKTYKDLMAGQLKGLRQQYKMSTGADDFDTHLLPATKEELGIGAPAGDGWKIEKVN